MACRDAVTLTGYLETDDAFTDCIAACDVALNLRWPTAREDLRTLAALPGRRKADGHHRSRAPDGRADVDPRTWRPNSRCSRASDDPAMPCAVAIDILDEDHSLRLAMRRLGTDPALRATLGAAARALLGARALDRRDGGRLPHAHRRGRPSAPRRPLRCRLICWTMGRGTLDRLIEPFGLRSPLGDGARSASAQ